MTDSPVMHRLPYGRPGVMVVRIPGQKGDDAEATEELRQGVATVTAGVRSVTENAKQTAEDRIASAAARSDADAARDAAAAAADTAGDQAKISTEQAVISKAQAELSGAERTVAQSAASEARLSAQSARITGKAYPTIQEGEAATAVNEVFSVLSTVAGGSVDFRVRTASGSTLRSTMPSEEGVTAIRNVAAPSIVSFGGKSIIYDYAAIYGGVRIFYFPRALSIQTAKGATSFTIGTESTRLPGYTELQLPNITSLFKVFVDRLTGGLSILAQNALPALSDDLLPLFEVRDDTISNARIPVEKVQAGRGNVHLYEPIVIEDGKLALIPQARWTNQAYSTLRPAPVNANGLATVFEKEVVVGNGGTPQVLCIDHIAAAKGLDPYPIFTDPRWPQSQSIAPIISSAQASAPMAQHTGHPLIGAVPNGSVPNVANIGQNGIDLLDVKLGSVGTVDFTDAALIALGYTKALTSLSKTSGFMGKAISDLRPGEIRFVRYVMEVDVDHSFPSFPVALVNYANLGYHGRPALMEKQLSARAAMFICWFPVPLTSANGPFKGIWAGSTGIGGRTIKIGGLQIGAGSKTKLWVMRADFPPVVTAAPEAPVYDLATMSKLAGKPAGRELLYPSEMFLVEKQEQLLYPDGMIEVRTDNQDLRISLEPVGLFVNDPNTPMPRTSNQQLSLVGGKVPPKVRILVRNVSASSDLRGSRVVDVRTALIASLNGLSCSWLWTGDSITYFCGIQQAAKRELTRLGINCSTIGTIPCQEQDQITGGLNLIMGEGRSGRDSTNYTYETASRTDLPCEPFPNSFIGEYLAMSAGNKHFYNPYLRPAVSGDPAAYVYNGHIIDFEFYRTRFNDYYLANGQPERVMGIPKFNILNIGTNEWSHGVAPDLVNMPARVPYVTHVHDAWAARSLAAWPNTYVGFMTNPLARSVNGDTRFPGHVAITKAILAVVEKYKGQVDGFGRPKVSLLPGLAHGSSEIGYELALGAGDANTGNTPATLADPLHVRGFIKEQVGIMAAHFMACRMVGA